MSHSIIKRDQVRLRATTDAPTATHEKNVRVLERDGKPLAVELTCSCGEVTVLELNYASDSQATGNSPS
ncbi:MAG: hypothetical protein AAF368_15725 [Planctomycetota bacterium]